MQRLCLGHRVSVSSVSGSLNAATRVVAEEALPDLGREPEGVDLAEDALERQQRVVGGEADLVLAEASS